MNFGLILFGICVVLYPVGQILEKTGMRQIPQITGLGQLLNFNTIFQIFTNPYVLGGIVLSALGLFLWLGAMSTLKISYMFPFGSMSYIILAFLAYFILHEGISPIRWAGIVTVVIGCYLINQ